jgi:uncharacterized protein with HEPN domain
MSRHDDNARLRHMLDYAAEAVEMARGHTRDELNANRQLNLSLTRLLEIIGEAAARVTPETRGSMSEIAWPEIVGLRNRLIHGYDEVDFDILWDTVAHNLPELVRVVRAKLSTD